jgi:hypothetical protein
VTAGLRSALATSIARNELFTAAGLSPTPPLAEGPEPRLELQDARSLAAPEDVAALLAAAGAPPTHLKTQQAVDIVWEFVAFVLTALVFLLIGVTTSFAELGAATIRVTATSTPSQCYAAAYGEPSSQSTPASAWIFAVLSIGIPA